MMQFQINRDWYTIISKGDGRYEVSRQGQGDSETYEATSSEVERLKKFASSPIIGSKPHLNCQS